MAQVLDLVIRDGCQMNALVGYLGEFRVSPCGHCSWCLTARPQRLAAGPALAPDGIDISAFRTVQAGYPEALGDPRQATRFLCGLNSPALTKHKLTRHELFGVFEDRRFADVLAWCER